MKRFLPALLFLFFAAFLASCDKTMTGHEILGKWEHAGDVFEFCEDGYLRIGDAEYPFSVSEHTVTVDRNGKKVSLEYALNPNGTLSLGDLIYYPVGQKLNISESSTDAVSSFFE